jgi:DNA-binding beta-propeller fold protein YncE/mono/diheme cytochrome c family protein
VLLADGRTLCVANRRSGTISLVDLHDGVVRDEVPVGDGLADLTALPDGRHLLTLDETTHELVALSSDGHGLAVGPRLAVGPDPVSVSVTPDGTRATVASLWSRRVGVIDVTPLSSAGGAMRVLHTVRLPFAPRLQCALPGGARVAVADAFGGHLAVLDVTSGRVVAVHELPGHNLRGLAVSADGRELLVAHQLLDRKAPATQENLRRGVLMANVVRRIPLAQLSLPGAKLDDPARLIRLGGVGAGAGDPAGVAALPGGSLAVALAGVHEVALLDAAGHTAHRVAVGRRPTRIVPAGDGRLVVLNTFDDSLSVLDPGRAAVARTIALGPRAKLSFRERGELLFYDARLSRDGWMSCHSCHTDGHTNGLNADTLGDNTYGTPKRTLTLLDTRMTDPWGWNGGMRYLHDQVEHSLRTTMHDPAVTPEQVGDLTTFLHNLPAPPPAEPVGTDPADRDRVERGRRVFTNRGCVRCHIPPLTYSSHDTHDVGLSDEKGLRKFNPPSLRGVGHSYRFLHDGRAATLEELFTEIQHPYGEEIEPGDLADLVRFLRSL